MDASTMLRLAAERSPARRAVVGRELSLSWAEWDARVTRLAHAVERLGVGRGGRVALAMTGGEPLASLHLAVQRLGATSVPLSTRFTVEETRYCIEDCDATVLIVDEAQRARGEAAAGAARLVGDGELEAAAGRAVDPEVSAWAPDPSDTAVVLYTSGTTGRPKGVPRSHRAESSAATAHAVQTRQGLGEVVLGVMPLFHTMGLRTLLTSILVGGTWVAQPSFDPDEAADLIIDRGVTSLYLVPTMYWSLLRTGRLGEASRLETVAYAGASMTPALIDELADTVAPRSFVNHFGSTEIYTFTVNPDVVAKPGAAGRAGIHARVRLVEPASDAPADALVGPGQQGQVAVRLDSPEAFAGYWRRPDADAKAIRDGWYFTGDLAVADDDGDLWVSGRVDDMINSGGENIYPDEIEAILSRCPGVADVCVVGLADDRWGHAVTAFVVPEGTGDPDATARATLEFARQHLPSLKRPKRVVAIDAIPRSGVGKTLRRVLVAGEVRPRGEARA